MTKRRQEENEDEEAEWERHVGWEDWVAGADGGTDGGVQLCVRRLQGDTEALAAWRAGFTRTAVAVLRLLFARAATDPRKGFSSLAFFRFVHQLETHPDVSKLWDAGLAAVPPASPPSLVQHDFASDQALHTVIVHITILYLSSLQ
ncbi:hypothetical protein HK100_003616 [Physocladia obscura]|uniref:Uncharacterized protein n=1 Tax=Physocladia obscura TaxID=109957 RepID=A0AAD5XAD0_9FUNG|nr:hypothetical protein HK100_003616 [Physocladia obscura]